MKSDIYHISVFGIVILAATVNCVVASDRSAKSTLESAIASIMHVLG